MDVHGSTIPPDVDSSTLLYNFNSSDTAGHGAQRSSHAHVFTDVLLGSFGAMGVLSNIAVLGILLQKKHRREAANLYLVNLAIADIWMGSFVPIRIIESNNVWTWTLPKCHAYVVMRYLPLFVNVNTIVLIAIERFVAIVLPTQFREFASERSVRLQVAAAWIVALFELGYDLDCVSVLKTGPNTKCLLYVDNVGCMFYMFALIIAVPAVVLIIFYGSIVMVVVSRSRKVQPTIPVPQSSEHHRRQQSQQQQQLQQQQLLHSARREKRAIRLAITCSAVTFLFIACWLPVHIIAFAFAYQLFKLPVDYIHMSNTLVYFHSSMNPAVYFCVDTRFRSVLARLACRANIVESSTTETCRQRQHNDQQMAGQSRDQGVTETDKI